MKRRESKSLIFGALFILAFILWTVLIQTVDVKPIGVNGTEIGFAAVNSWFHKMTGVNFTLYHITDWLGLVPVAVCAVFGIIGLIQWITRKSLLKVDFDIIILGVYYVIIILGYIIFEMYPINYRPVLINAFLEASYPSSTTLLVLGVMPTAVFEAQKRLKNIKIKRLITIIVMIFSVFMVTGRLLSGVHWFTDIIGSVLLCVGLFCIYKAVVNLRVNGVEKWNLDKNF